MYNFLRKIPDITILCVGDIMLDKFVYGKVNRISPEAPVQVLNPTKTKEMLGGCGNVVANLATLGCNTIYLGIVGNDENGRKVGKLLKQCGSKYKLLKLDDYSTIVKTRFIAGNNHILRLDEEEKLPLIKKLLPKYERILDKAIQNSDIVLLSDYNKGIFSKETTQMIINLCKKYNKKIIVDPKGNNYKKYAGATFIKPNLKEFNEATSQNTCPTDNDFEAQIKNGAQHLFKECSIENLLITMSEYGILHVSAEDNNKIYRLPTQAREVFDVSGAGDTTIAVFTLAIALGMSTLEAMKLANIAAGIVVGKVGTACVSLSELKQAIDSVSSINTFEHSKKIYSLKDILEKDLSDRITIINNDFDELTLEDLEKIASAKNNCETLIIALNSDKYAKEQNGHATKQKQDLRSNIMSALCYVDYVVIINNKDELNSLSNKYKG